MGTLAVLAAAVALLETAEAQAVAVRALRVKVTVVVLVPLMQDQVAVAAQELMAATEAGTFLVGQVAQA